MSDQTSDKKGGCPECGSDEDWGGASWCPACGYYPALNRQVVAPPSPDEEEVYDHWWQMVPVWAWTMLACVGGLFVLSVAARVIFNDSPMRTWWTIGQMGIGVVVLSAVHFMAYLFSVSQSDKIGPFDMFMQPVAIWMPVFRELPGSSKLVTTLACSITAIVLGIFVVDGIDYLAIMQDDASARKQAMAEQEAKDRAEGKKKKSAMGFMLQSASAMSQAQQAGGPAAPDSLEDALADFAGEAGVMEGGGLMGGGGDAPAGMGGIDSAITGFTAMSGVDTDAYMDQQKAIASGGGSDGSPTAESSGEDSSDRSSITDSEGAAGSSERTSTARSSTPASRTGTSPVSTSTESAGRTGSRASSRDGITTMPSFPKEEVECLVLGYTTNATGELRSLLLAAAPDRKQLRFVAKVPADEVDAKLLNAMVARFADIPARGTIVRCPYGGRWLQPKLFCIVAFSGWTADNRLAGIEVLRLVASGTK